MGTTIGNIATHNAAPSGSNKIEMENPTGPASEWCTLDEMIGTRLIPTPISFDSAGTAAAATATTIAPALPATIKPGSVLIAVAHSSTGSLTVSVSTGWTLGKSNSQTLGLGATSAWAWKVATGSDTAPTFTFSTSSNLTAQVVQYLITNVGVPVGANSVNHSSGTADVPSASTITTLYNYSYALNIIVINGNVTVTNGASGWATDKQTSQTNGSFGFFSKSYPDKGTATGSISSGMAATTTWTSYLIELTSRGPGS